MIKLQLLTINVWSENKSPPHRTTIKEDSFFSIPPKHTVIFMGEAKERTVPRQFVITAPNPDDLWIMDIKMGDISQFSLGCTHIPVETFLEGFPMNDVKFDTLEVSHIASVCIQNDSDEARDCQIVISDESPNLLPTMTGEYHEVGIDDDDDDGVVFVVETPKK